MSLRRRNTLLTLFVSALALLGLPRHGWAQG